jgi:hypothetical protein
VRCAIGLLLDDLVGGLTIGEMIMDGKQYEPPSFTEQFHRVPPSFLHHYTGQAGMLGIVENAELWGTKIQYMNDATEFGLALRLARQLLENMVNSSESSAERSACARLLQSLQGLEDINIFAVCFCEDGDLLSQWKGYAGGGEGYSIGFDVDALMQIADRSGFVLGPCIYDVGVQRRIIDEAVAHCVQGDLALPSQRRWGFHGPLADVLFRCGVFFKDMSFEDEKEWRLVSSTILYDNEHIRFRQGNSMITPYYKLPIRHEEGLPIRYVVVGPCPHMELAKSAVTSLLMRHGLRGPLNGQQVAVDSVIPFRNW